MTDTKNAPVPGCETKEIHPDILKRVQSALPEDTDLNRLAELYKVFGDTTRIKILYALSQTELCVCDLAELLGVTVSAVSHQLRLLKQAKLVNCRRAGRQAYYALADDHVKTIIGMAKEHIEE